MSHERDQASLQHHIKEAEDRAGYRTLYVAFDRLCPGPENGRARPTPARQRKERHQEQP